MKTLYFDCFSGISGDMTIGALIDLGADIHLLEKELKKLDLNDEYNLNWEKVVKKGISATKFDVILTENETDNSHHQDHHQDKHHYKHHHHHQHEHHHEHHHHAHHHHRHYSDIVTIIKNAEFNENVQTMALAVFEKIGRAEAKIHNIPFEKVHFHEVGAVDSIIDIVGTCILLDQLKVTKIVSSAVPVGNGHIKIAHGKYPVPAPATLEILKGLPIKATEIEGELTTPTGAGILSALTEEFGPIPSFNVNSIGYGAGTKDFPEHPNVLRIILGTS
ncbi:nickel pincer cofactor biosynthesis protein LarC [Bacillaceae bacterium C204]|uniref:nickel pincer cofactor biosynthesis protein LarC n=1 Tax=Neobacillus sp. 204 TaxID=3383351 RepID=UPI00397E5F01